MNSEKIPTIVQNECCRCGAIIPPNSLDDYYHQYCWECQEFGKVTAGFYLWRYEREVDSINHQMRLKFELSAEQKNASHYLLESIKKDRIGYLHAVCGAGKTEILYESILYCLNHHYRICFAIPRTDVVKELYSRLITIFPVSTIKPLYQGHHDDHSAQLIISTVHQLIHYYQEFHLLILDEADAFPYKNNPLLNRLVTRAIKTDGSFIMMSATFRSNQLIEITKSKKPYYRLPARYHGHFLDQFSVRYIPKIRTDDFRINVPKEIDEWLKRKVENNQVVMMFVPVIHFGELLYRHYKKQGYNILNVSSIEPNRHQIIQQFKQGESKILITTTLLERGVTIKGLDVAVIKANHAVFDRDTLVQIAGRVGRHFDEPSGEIVLFAERNTKEITAAKKYVKMMNKEAQLRGLISNDL